MLGPGNSTKQNGDQWTLQPLLSVQYLLFTVVPFLCRTAWNKAQNFARISTNSWGSECECLSELYYDKDFLSWPSSLSRQKYFVVYNVTSITDRRLFHQRKVIIGNKTLPGKYYPTEQGFGAQRLKFSSPPNRDSVSRNLKMLVFILIL